MTRQQALRLSEKHGQPIVVPNSWGRFDYAFPGGVTSHADTNAEVEIVLMSRGCSRYFLVKPECLASCTITPDGSAI